MSKQLVLVAPLVGAWIEITGLMMSRKTGIVAPLVGAWIEIDETSGTMYGAYYVAPLVGAWIEIDSITDNEISLMSLLSWERGLKLYIGVGASAPACRSSRGSVD